MDLIQEMCVTEQVVSSIRVRGRQSHVVVSFCGLTLQTMLKVHLGKRLHIHTTLTSVGTYETSPVISIEVVDTPTNI